jgi:RNA polymerase sigma factor (sigma-70 family)
LEEVPDMSSVRSRELIALDEALTQLAGIDPRKARVIELRFFGGLNVEETATMLNVSQDTVLRDWLGLRPNCVRSLDDAANYVLNEMLATQYSFQTSQPREHEFGRWE